MVSQLIRRTLPYDDQHDDEAEEQVACRPEDEKRPNTSNDDSNHDSNQNDKGLRPAKVRFSTEIDVRSTLANTDLSPSEQREYRYTREELRTFFIEAQRQSAAMNFRNGYRPSEVDPRGLEKLSGARRVEARNNIAFARNVVLLKQQELRKRHKLVDHNVIALVYRNASLMCSQAAREMGRQDSVGVGRSDRSV